MPEQGHRLIVCNVSALTFKRLSHRLLVDQLHVQLRVARRLHEHNVLQHGGMPARWHGPTLRYGRTRGRPCMQCCKRDGLLAAISPTLAFVSKSTASTSSLHTSACMGGADWGCAPKGLAVMPDKSIVSWPIKFPTASQHACQLQPPTFSLPLRNSEAVRSICSELKSSVSAPQARPWPTTKRATLRSIRPM